MGCLPGCKILTLFLTSILKAFSSLFMNSNYMCKLKETLFMKMLQTVSFLTIASWVIFTCSILCFEVSEHVFVSCWQSKVGNNYPIWFQFLKRLWENISTNWKYPQRIHLHFVPLWQVQEWNLSNYLPKKHTLQFTCMNVVKKLPNQAISPGTAHTCTQQQRVWLFRETCPMFRIRILGSNLKHFLKCLTQIEKA